MRKSVMILGGVSAAAAILLAAAFATAAWERSALDKGARNQSDSVASVVPQQNPDEPIQPSIAPERLGSLALSARYLAWVRIEKGRAAFQVLVMQRDGKWLVHGYPTERTQKVAAE